MIDVCHLVILQINQVLKNDEYFSFSFYNFNPSINILNKTFFNQFTAIH